jgi:hypothetical protein
MATLSQYGYGNSDSTLFSIYIERVVVAAAAAPAAGATAGAARPAPAPAATRHHNHAPQRGRRAARRRRVATKGAAAPGPHCPMAAAVTGRGQQRRQCPGRSEGLERGEAGEEGRGGEDRWQGSRRPNSTPRREAHFPAGTAPGGAAGASPRRADGHRGEQTGNEEGGSLRGKEESFSASCLLLGRQQLFMLEQTQLQAMLNSIRETNPQLLSGFRISALVI